VTNIGGSQLTELNLVDGFAAEFGSGFVGVTMGPVLSIPTLDGGSMDPTINGSFTGFAGSDNMLAGTDGILASGDAFTVSVQVELDMDQLPNPAFNQATTSANDEDGNPVTDDSDDNSDIDGDTMNDNETGGEDDPTGLPPFPSINVAKSVNVVEQSPTSVDHYFVTYRHKVQNTGNTVLESLSLMDDIDAALQGGYVAGSAIVTVLTGDIPAQMNPTSSPAYDGTGEMLSDADGILNPGENYIVDVTVEVDVTLITTPPSQPLLNQSSAEGLPTDGMGNVIADPTSGDPFMDGDVVDDSDSGTDPDGNNAGAPNDSGGYDDPTPLHLPGGIAVIKDIQGYVAATSGTPGNYDVTIDFTIENTGSNNITNIELNDMLAAQWGDAFVGVTTAPAISTPGADGTTTDPTVNAGYDGDFDSELLSANGELAPDEFMVVTLVVEIDASESPATGLENQASTTGIDATGTIVDDLSDDNTASGDASDPDGDNPNGAGDDGIGGTNNPSPLTIPEISNTKEVASVTPAASGVQGNVDVTFSIIVENTGTIPLENILLEDDAATQLAPAFVMYVGNPIIVASGATEDPIAGTMPGMILLDGTDGILLPGEQVTVEFTVELDASEIPTVGLTNQSVATGTPTDGMSNPMLDLNDPIGMAELGDVSDVSDSGNTPDSNNTDAEGDMDTPNDPTPLTPIPSIGVAKAVSSVDLAASGTAGNFDVQYTFVIENIGTATLDNVSLDDDLANQLGGAFVGVTVAPAIDGASTAVTAGDANVDYAGTGLETELLDLMGTLEPSETIVVNVIVEIDPDAVDAILNADNEMENQGTASADPLGDDGNPLLDSNGNPVGLVTDDSDNGTGADSDNGDGGTNDSTPLLVPSIGVAKAITNVVEASSGVEGNFDVTIKYTVVNDGNTNLQDLSLEDEIAAQWGASYVAPIVSAPIITINGATSGPTSNAGYMGSGDLLAPAMTDLLKPGQSFMVEVIVEVDASMAGGSTLMNQATSSGTPVDVDGNTINLPGTGDIISVFDDSDNGIDPSGDNGEGGNDDPSPLDLPSVGVAKAAGTPVAVLGMPGLYDVEFTFLVENTGNTPLTSISLADDFDSQFGAAFVEVTVAPMITAATTPATQGGVNAGFTGQGDPFDEILDGMGALLPQENITVTTTVRVDGSMISTPNTLINQSTALGSDPNGDVVTDMSNNGTDPEGGDDPTPTSLPCFAEIVCPVAAVPIVQDNDFGWCAAVVTFPGATLNTDCSGVDEGDIQFMLSVEATDPNSESTVTSGVWINGQASGLMYDVGTTTVSYRVDPAVLPIGSVIDPVDCSFDIIIIDKQSPTTICMDIEVELDDMGMVSIVPDDINGGTTDNCNDFTLAIDVMDFTCDDIGLNSVILTATDDTGNNESCVATVTVIDAMDPIEATPSEDELVNCDGAGNTTDLTTWLASNGGFTATDNCDDPLTYTYDFISQNNLCDFTGSSTYTFTATDASGNSVSSTATFTIQDIIRTL